MSMLWYKAWLETRVRFLICLGGITALCAWNVYQTDREITTIVSDAFYSSVLHARHELLVLMWVLAVNLIMMGGLLREKATGAASFTLALPVGRARMAGVRIAVGLIQMLVLIALPWIGMYLAGSAFGRTHSVSQVFFHAGLMAGGGVVYFAIALVAASVVDGEYTAPIAAFGVVLVIASTLSSPGTRTYNPLYFMMGSGFYNGRTALLAGPIPWAQIGIYALIAACLTWGSIKALQARDF